MNFLNFNEDSKNLMYVFENDKIKEILLEEIKKKKLKLFKKILMTKGFRWLRYESTLFRKIL